MILTDDIKRTVNFLSPPATIVSLCPSVTETLCDLGLSEKIIGITDYCIHPKDIVKNINKVGGTKTVSITKVKTLKPEIIFAVKEENSKKTIKILSEIFPCYVFDINSFSDALKMINTLGEIFSKTKNATSLSENIVKAFSKIQVTKQHVDYLYFVWKNPWMVAGNNTYIESLLSKFYLKNIINKSKYPKIELKNISSDPQIIFLPSEPYKFSKTDKMELQKVFPKSKILLVNGEMFSWYGSRMVKAAVYIEKLLK